MGTRLHVGNLSRQTTEADLENLFNRVGLVLSVSIPSDERTGVRKQFGYVDMTSEGAQAAIKSLHGSVLHQHELSVSEAGQKE